MMKRGILLIALVFSASPANAQSPRRTENVIIVTLDGVRFQELFTGADDVLMHPKHGGVKDVADLRKRFWRDDPVERREVLFPFLWKTMAVRGQLFGDQGRKAPARLSNGLKFSYPGYNEMFCGFADKRIKSNDKRPNPNVNVFEFLNALPRFKGRIGIFCTWDVFPSIFNEKRSGLKVQCAWNPIRDEPLSERQRTINAMVERLPRYWPTNAFDVVTMEASLEHVRRHKPRVLYVALGETDEWCHARRYDLYLDSAQKSDAFLQDLWSLCQKMPEYAGKTSLIVTTDHGRGPTRENWTDHGRDIPSAEFIWITVMGPDTPALGVREHVAVGQAQLAATIAHLLGEDFRAVHDDIALPLPGVVGE